MHGAVTSNDALAVTCAQLFHDLMGTGVLQISTGGALPKGKLALTLAAKVVHS